MTKSMILRLCIDAGYLKTEYFPSRSLAEQLMMNYLT